MTPTYKASLTDCNIAVALGEVSNNICAIDIDLDHEVDPFLKANPALADTFQTRGNRGRVFWIRCNGQPPKTRNLKTATGADFGEWRSTGSYSLVHGIHPTGKRYEWIVRKPVVVISYDSIVWPDGNNSEGNSPLRGGIVKGETAKGNCTKGCPPNTVVGGGGGVVVGLHGLDAISKSQIDKAIVIGANSTTSNNKASFTASIALTRIRGKRWQIYPPMKNDILPSNGLNTYQIQAGLLPAKSKPTI